MISFASSGESKSGGGGNVFLFIPPDCHRKKITKVECGIKLTRSHNFSVKASRVNSYKKAGLKPRRAYETRHTAAVLHIAAHENPIYISHKLGHSDTKLLFEVYAPYVANASRQDGNAFNDMMLGGAA